MAWRVLLPWPGTAPFRATTQKEAERVATWLRSAAVYTIIYPEGEFPEVNEAGEIVYKKPGARKSGKS